MKKGLAVLVVVAVGFGIYWFKFRTKDAPNDIKPAPISVKKHSEAFNTSIDKMVTSYLGIKDAFVDADTAKAKAQTKEFIGLLDQINLDELKKDTAAIVETVKGNIADIRSNAVSLLEQKDITEMRQDFRMVTDMMYPSFFKTINYEGQTLYLENCPMAFGEDKDANWISNNAEIVNPYLGKHHPEFKATMLHCGEVKDSISVKAP